MLPIGAFKTAEQKRELSRRVKSAVKKANKLGAWKMKRNNTCDDCGHYMTTHTDKGCRCHVWNKEEGKAVTCPCERKGQPSPALQPAPERG